MLVNPVPVDVEFLGDHHGDGRPQALADLRVFQADNHAAVRIDLEEEAQHALAFLFVRECRQADDEAAGGAQPGDQHLAARDAISPGRRIHDFSPAAISAARWMALRMRT